MPGVGVISTSADIFCALLRSTPSPAAIFGAIAGSTSAVQAVEVSPSIARLGSPKLVAGEVLGVYVGAALVSRRIDCGCSAFAPPVPVVLGVVVAGVGAVAVADGIGVTGVDDF